MVGVFVDHDRIGIPQPVAAIRNFIWENAEVPPVEPESRGTAAGQVIDVARSETSWKMAVFPGVIDMETCVVCGRVAYPTIISRMNMRGVGMAFGVPEVACRRRMPFLPRRRMRLLPGSPVGLRCWAVSRNVTATHFAVWRASVFFVLSGAKREARQQRRNSDDQTNC